MPSAARRLREALAGLGTAGTPEARDRARQVLTRVGLPQDRERIVEPYVTTREKGTGLGLAIVNKIVDEHGGDMSFASAPSGGTRVSLRFARNPNPIEGGPL